MSGKGYGEVHWNLLKSAGQIRSELLQNNGPNIQGISEGYLDLVLKATEAQESVGMDSFCQLSSSARVIKVVLILKATFESQFEMDLVNSSSQEILEIQGCHSFKTVAPKGEIQDQPKIPQITWNRVRVFSHTLVLMPSRSTESLVSPVFCSLPSRCS